MPTVPIVMAGLDRAIAFSAVGAQISPFAGLELVRINPARDDFDRSGSRRLIAVGGCITMKLGPPPVG